MAAREFGTSTASRPAAELGADPFEAMAPFRRAVDAFHDAHRAADWLEGLIKAYVGDGLAADFYREVAEFVDAETRELIIEVLTTPGAEFVVDRVRKAIEADPGGRPAGAVGAGGSWARRSPRPSGWPPARRARALAGRRRRPAGLDLAAIGRMFTRLTENHPQRWLALGSRREPPREPGLS